MNWKTIIKLKLLLALCFFALASISTHAQQRTCGMVKVMQEKMKDPEYAKEYKKRQEEFRTQLNKNLAKKSIFKKRAPLVIPVAVHFPSGIESERAGLQALAQNQIDILNDDFNGTNSDISNWAAASPFYPGVNTGASNVIFCLATRNHPTGIDPDMIEGGPAVTVGYNFGNGNDEDSAWAGYMNIVVKDLADGLLGYSPLGGSIADGASVVIGLSFFGSGPGCPGSFVIPSPPYNLGRTVTHELGHFFNLNHVFTGNCNTDDGISDTPNQSEESSGCPSLGNLEACVNGQQALFQNYMDYSDDRCLFMFTQGQINVVDAYLDILDNQIKSNVGTCSSVESFSLSSKNTDKSICKPTSSVAYNFSYVTGGGNTSPTTFSVSGLPNGVNANFSPTSINNNGSVTLTLTNLNTANDGNYPITITGNGAITTSLNVNITIDGSVPNTPTLTTPNNNATNTSIFTSLNWEASSKATSYVVETATNIGFTANKTSAVVTTNTYSPSLLSDLTTYFWRVKAVNSCGETSFSSTRKFTTFGTECADFESTQNNLSISSNGFSSKDSTINIDIDETIAKLKIAVNINHTFISDLDLVLTSPSGTSVTLLSEKCPEDSNIAAIFDDLGSNIQCNFNSPAISGNVKPDNPLSAFRGENTKGNWVLTITDFFEGDGGTFLNYSIEVCYANTLSNMKYDLDKDVSISPNPSNGQMTLNVNTLNDDNITVRLFDLRGRLINKQVFKNSEGFSEKLNYQNLKSSVYIMSIENAGKRSNKRIIIE